MKWYDGRESEVKLIVAVYIYYHIICIYFISQKREEWIILTAYCSTYNDDDN